MSLNKFTRIPLSSPPQSFVTIIVVACLLVSYHALGDENFPGIKKLMSEEEFIKAGLNNQTPKELDALNKWLIRYTANDAQYIKQASIAVKQEEKKDIQATIIGQFNGWNGDTLFQLSNGQVWKQRLTGTWKTDLQNPEIMIYKNFFGFYEMKVLNAKRKVGVKRIK